MLSQESSVTLKAFCLILGTHTFDLSDACYSFCEYWLCTADSGQVFVELNYSVLEIRETGLFQPKEFATLPSRHVRQPPSRHPSPSRQTCATKETEHKHRSPAPPKPQITT